MLLSFWILFNINKLNVEYWEDFDGDDINKDTIEEAASNIGVSYKSTLTNDVWSTYDTSSKYLSETGVLSLNETSSIGNNAMRFMFGDQDDYLQFELENTGAQAKTYTLSFMFRFESLAGEKGLLEYELPLKFIALDEKNEETMLKDNIHIPYRCNSWEMYSRSFYEVAATVDVDAGKTIRLQLKMTSGLPTICPKSKAAHAGVPHPVECSIDNISISSGRQATISVKKGETYQLSLDTVSTDTVEYFTNCQLTEHTHDATPMEGADPCSCTFTTVASVDETGLITASEVGETGLIAVITHEDGAIERKQCTVRVTE